MLRWVVQHARAVFARLLEMEWASGVGKVSLQCPFMKDAA
jgi:hypothetical protein